MLWYFVPRAILPFYVELDEQQQQVRLAHYGVERWRAHIDMEMTDSQRTVTSVPRLR